MMQVTCRHGPGITTLAVGRHLSGSAIGERFTRVRALMRPQTCRTTVCMARTRCPFSSQRRRPVAEAALAGLSPLGVIAVFLIAPDDRCNYHRWVARWHPSDV